jgi:protein-S-isoprenylcysteine O-methyltransferase Ste14
VAVVKKEAGMSRLAVFFLMILAPALALILALFGLETLWTNLLGWFLLVFGIAYMAGGLIYYFIRRQPFWQPTSRGKAVEEKKGDRSFWAILPGFLAVFFAPPFEFMYWHLFPNPLWLQITGLGIVVAALVLLLWSRAYIRGLYSGHVEVQAEHKLVQSGPYCFVRHPSYAGFLLIALGLATGYSSWIGVAALLLLLLPGLIYRIRVEERLLEAKFGEEFRAYTSRSKKLIPGIW